MTAISAVGGHPDVAALAEADAGLRAVE